MMEGGEGRSAGVVLVKLMNMNSSTQLMRCTAKRDERNDRVVCACGERREGRGRGERGGGRGGGGDLLCMIFQRSNVPPVSRHTCGYMRACMVACAHAGREAHERDVLPC